MSKKDESLIDQLAVQSEHKTRAENLSFDIDVWYPSLKQFTFRTIFRPLSRLEAHAIVKYYQRRFLERKGFSNQDEDILISLENELDQLIRKQFPGGAFLRLCGRSPKDAEPLHREEVWSKYQSVLKDLHAKGCPHSTNTKLQAIARVNWMCVRSGKEAMSLLLTSERVFTDLLDWLKFGEPEQIVLREFDPRILLDYEFRVYVNRGKITAISQYDHYAVYPHLFPLKEKIQSRILEKWSEVHPHVKSESYAMDFIYFPDEDQVAVIELSPFLPCTGPALFHWVKTKDLLENGPMEFRLNETEHPDLGSLVQSNWEHRWTENIRPYWEHFAEFNPRIVQRREVSQVIVSLLFVGIGSLMIGYYDWRASSQLFLIGSGLIFFLDRMNARAQATESLSWKPKNTQLVFVYGTLKRGFHWSEKFMHTCEFIGEATTVEKYPLVFGDSGVPYLLGDIPNREGKNIKGEIWRVDEDSLRGIDDFEGTLKGSCERRTISVRLNNTSEVFQSFVYFSVHTSEGLRNRELHEEYPLDYHVTNYNAIRNIQLKQYKYLGISQDDDEH